MIIENLDEERITYIYNKTLENKSIQISNSKIWTYFLDNKLRDFVIEYNFNFFEIANRFHEFIAYPFKYDFSEDEIRRHWAFLNACRFLGKEIDDDYYDEIKVNSKNLEKDGLDLLTQEKLDLEKDQKEQEKIRAERFSMIDISMPIPGKEKKIDEIKLEETVIDKSLKNDEQFERFIDDLKVTKEASNSNEEEIVNTNFNTENENKKDNKFITYNQEEIKDNNEDKDSVIDKNELNNLEASANKGLNFDDEDDVITALFNGVNNLNIDLGKIDIAKEEKDLFEKYKDKSNEELNKSEVDHFPIDTTRNIDTEDLSEEALIKKREDMLKEFNEDDLYREIDSTKTFNDLLNEDEKLKKTNDDLNAYFNFTRKSMKFLIPKLEKSFKYSKDRDVNIDIENKGKKN
jgi:hypothetical protein